MWNPFKFFIERREKIFVESDKKLLESIRKNSCEIEEDIDLSGMPDLKVQNED